MFLSTIKNAVLIIFTLLICLNYTLSSVEVCPIEAEKQLQQLVHELEYGDAHLGKMGLILGRFQDVLLAHLEGDVSDDQYEQEIEYLEGLIQKFDRFSDYVFADSVKLKQPKWGLTQTFALEPGHPLASISFMDSFKSGRILTAQEREEAYEEEYLKYVSVATEIPQLLTKEALANLLPGQVYAYVLLPSGEVFYSRDDKKCPNHAILSGNAHQNVLTAGLFVFYAKENRRLYFISNQSGHFRPTPWSLHTIKKVFRELDDHPLTIITGTDVDYSKRAVNDHPDFFVSPTIDPMLGEKIFRSSYQHWKQLHEKFDWRAYFSQFLSDDYDMNCNMIHELTLYKKAGNKCRSVFYLFDKSFDVEPTFFNYVALLGNLRDSMNHGERKAVREYAAQLIKKLDEGRLDHINTIFRQVTPEAFLVNYYSIIAEIEAYTTRETLTLEEYHQLRLRIRDLFFLFLCSKEERCHYHLSNVMCCKMESICKAMGHVLDSEYVADRVSHRVDATTEQVKLPEDIKKNIVDVLRHLNPPLNSNS